MLQDHPTVEDLTGFLRDASRPGHAARNSKILRHLLAECRVCHDRLDVMGWSGSRLEHLVYISGRMDGREEQPQARANGYNYDRAFARAEQAIDDFLAVAPLPRMSPGQLLKELDQVPHDRQLALVEEDESFSVPQLVDLLIERSHTARYADPEMMLHWARLARGIAARSSAESLGSAPRLADLRARAWGQYGNALRVASRLPEAEKTMVTAQAYLKEGTGDPALKAKLNEQIASLYTFQRRFNAAITVLADAAEIYRQLGETHAFARTLIQEAIASLYAGEADSAVGLLNQAIPLIDHEEDPHLLLAACHNLVRCYIDLERPEQALSIYSETRDLYKEFGDSLILLRANWQEGQLLRDLGHLRAAETALLRARQGFLERDLMYEVALVGLDLAALYVKLKAIDYLKETVIAMVPIFRALRVDREALASLLQLQQVADQEQQAMELIRFLNARIEPLAKRGLLK
jgi:tetratricopeptide (TPR) repeat protein